MHDNVDVNVYKNFMILSTAINLLSRTDISGSTECARGYLHTFIEHFIQLYGKQNAVYNIHNLSHLPDDVERYGTIDQFSAYCFENYLGVLKKMLRKPNKPLEQIIKRLAERDVQAIDKLTYPILKKSHTEGPLIMVDESVSQQYKEIYLEKYCFKVSEADHGIMIKDEIGCVRNIVKSKQCISIVYQTFQAKEIFF